MLVYEDPTQLTVLSNKYEFLFHLPIIPVEVGDQLAMEEGYGTNLHYEVIKVDGLVVIVLPPVTILDVMYN